MTALRMAQVGFAGEGSVRNLGGGCLVRNAGSKAGARLGGVFEKI